jgi:hypothetical protein
MLLGTGSSSEVSAVSEATLLMTCAGNTILEQDMVSTYAIDCLGRVMLYTHSVSFVPYHSDVIVLMVTYRKRKIG